MLHPLHLLHTHFFTVDPPPSLSCILPCRHMLYDNFDKPLNRQQLHDLILKMVETHQLAELKLAWVLPTPRFFWWVEGGKMPEVFLWWGLRDDPARPPSLVFPSRLSFLFFRPKQEDLDAAMLRFTTMLVNAFGETEKSIKLGETTP